MKNAFLFTLKGRVTLKIFKFCPDLFGQVGKQLYKKAKVNFEIYDFIYWGKIITNTYCPIFQEEKLLKQ